MPAAGLPSTENGLPCHAIGLPSVAIGFPPTANVLPSMAIGFPLKEISFPPPDFGLPQAKRRSRSKNTNCLIYELVANPTYLKDLCLILLHSFE